MLKSFPRFLRDWKELPKILVNTSSRRIGRNFLDNQIDGNKINDSTITLSHSNIEDILKKIIKLSIDTH
jgi:hypothetical protein